MSYPDAMTADECNDRAAMCAANAGLALSEPVSQEFLRLAAQWRAMAGRVIFLERLDEPVSVAGALDAIAAPTI